jgi:hypothetical protein
MNFFNRSTRAYPTIREALAASGLTNAADPAALGVLKKQGSYAGRRVNYFRAFEPARATARAIQVQAYGDLDAHLDLILGSGHVEHEGLVMLNSRPEPEHTAPLRSLADRATHADDERFVNRHGRAMKSPPVLLPEPST